MKTEIGIKLQEMAEMELQNHTLFVELSQAQSIHKFINTFLFL